MCVSFQNYNNSILTTQLPYDSVIQKDKNTVYAKHLNDMILKIELFPENDMHALRPVENSRKPNAIVAFYSFFCYKYHSLNWTRIASINVNEVVESYVTDANSRRIIYRPLPSSTFEQYLEINC